MITDDVLAAIDQSLRNQATTQAKPVEADLINLIIANDYMRGLFQRDLFAGHDIITKQPPWEATDRSPFRITDGDELALMIYLQQLDWKKMSIDIAHRLSTHLSSLNTFDRPVQWLDQQEWDGIERLPTLFKDFFGTPGSALESRATIAWFIQGVHRIRWPGANCKAELMLVLVGAEALYKSQFGKDLVPVETWFTDQLPTDLDNKDAKMAVQGRLIIEMGEMSQMNKTDAADMKRWASTNIDEFREPYGRNFISRPRRCIFYGTSNRIEILRDETGNRRFFPIEIERRPQRGAIAAIANQLWAEADVRARQFIETGGEYWLTQDEEDQAKSHRSRFMVTDFYDDAIDAAMGIPITSGPNAGKCAGECWFRINALTNQLLGEESLSVKNREQRLIKQALLRQGYQEFVINIEGTVVRAFHVTPRPKGPYQPNEVIFVWPTRTQH